ncbi:MAG TPA: AAA family ATPase, partial [Nocardioidaceae bacterium]
MLLLERDGHVASLVQYAEEARAGHGRTVLMAGEAGVGKSSLLDALEQELTDALWYWGTCDGLFTPRPLAPLLDIADQIGGELKLLCDSGAPRDQLFSELVRHLHTPDRLTVLAIEDVHWADEATLDLLRFLGRRLRDSATLLVITYRDDGLAQDDPLRVAVGELSMHRTTRRLSLAPLSTDAVAGMAAAAGADPARLYALTGGNPYYVCEVLQTAEAALPESVRDAVLARVAAVSANAREVLDVAALMGARVDHQLLERATGASSAILDELLACGVIVSDADQLRFRHEIARMAIQSAIPPHRIRSTHRTILDALLQAGLQDDARLAFHAEGAGDVGLVLEYAPRAGRRASELAAHREAAAQFERSLRAADQADDRTTASLYDDLAGELALVDRWQDSANAREEALRRWRAVGDPLREGDSLRRYSRVMWRLCRGDEADSAAVKALELLAPLGPSPELAWAYANLANNK